MEAAWQDVQQEAADELLGREHDLLPSAPSRRYLVTEGKAALIETDEAPVRDGLPESGDDHRTISYATSRERPSGGSLYS
jgi:hypothetical protein